MKAHTHPTYGPVAFRDRSTGRIFLTRSTLAGRLGERPEGDERRIYVDGEHYPVVDVDLSCDSHPVWTGRRRTTDTEGRVQAFERRYGGAS